MGAELSIPPALSIVYSAVGLQVLGCCALFYMPLEGGGNVAWLWLGVAARGCGAIFPDPHCYGSKLCINSVVTELGCRSRPSLTA